MLLIVQRLFIKMFSTKLCACGEDAAIFLYGKSSYQHGKVEVINNAIDVSKFRPDKRIFKKYCFISGPVTTLAIPALLGEHVTGPYEGQIKPPLEVVVVS